MTSQKSENTHAIKEELEKHPERYSQHTDQEYITQDLAKKYDISQESAAKIIAEWSAGRESIDID